MFRSSAITMVLCFATVTAQAALLGRAALTPGGTDYQAVYDTDLNITWLADANYAQTSGYDADGLMSWLDSQAWIASLNAANHLDQSSWRLPVTVQPDTNCDEQNTVGGIVFAVGYNCTGAEMGHLFYSELGGEWSVPIAATHNSSYDLFQNLQDGFYWTGSLNPLFATSAWYFRFEDGTQRTNPADFTYFAWAVHDGDTLATVPAPPAIWLLGTGLGLMGWMRRKAAA